MKCEKGLQIAIPMVLCLLLVLPASAVLGVNDITPYNGLNTGTVFITNLSGTDFPDEPDVLVTLNMTGEDSIIAQYVTVASPTKITCVFDITGAKAGVWNVFVINKTSGEDAFLPSGFTVFNPHPDVVSITPDNGVNNVPVTITNLAGDHFLPGATVNLTKDSQPTITATDVVVSPTQISCVLNITNAAPGDWNVVVTNYDGNTDALPNGFNVRYPTPAVTAIAPSAGVNNGVIGITNLSGSGFMQGANVTLRQAGQLDIETINGPIVEPGKILCFFDLNGVHVGKWDVVVTNPDLQEGILADGFTVLYPDSPDVTGINPATGVNTGTTIADVGGSGFHQNATVRLSLGVHSITGSGGVVSSGSITGIAFDLTGAPAGAWDVTVTNDDGKSSTRAGSFTVTNPPPTVSSLTPDTGPNNVGWFDITNLSGTGFLPGANVTFTRGATSFAGSGVNVTGITSLSCKVFLTGIPAGLYDVTVTNSDGLSGTKTGAFTVVNPAPVVNAISPSSWQNTGPVTILALTGENFLDGAGVNLTKAAETPIPGTMVSWLNSTTLTCTFDLTGASAGAWDVEVVNPDGRSGSNPGLFTITNPPPHPQTIFPSCWTNNGPVGITALTGTGFLDHAAVALRRAGEADINGTSVAVNVTTQTIMCFFNLNGAKVGPWDVDVTNTDGQSGSLAGGFFVKYPAAPVITGISPSHGVNNGVFTISNISGTGFQPGATVNLSMDGQADIPGAIGSLSPTRISADFDLSGRQTGWWDVVVTNDDGQSYTYEFGFQVRYPAPTIGNLTPAKGPNDRLVSITNLSGTGFRNNASVRLNSTLGADIVAGNVTVVTPVQISCTLDLAGKAIGNWDVVVTNDDGQSGTRAAGFAVEYPDPHVTAIDPPKASNDGVVVINNVTGTNFRNGATVWLIRNLQSIQGTDVHFIDAQTLNCTFDLTGATPGQWTVAVINPDQKYGTLLNGFRVLPPAPVPIFTANPTLGTVPLTVQFTDQSLNNPIGWVWDFGDGTLAGIYEKNPVHTYNKIGSYDAVLTVYFEGQEIRSDPVRIEVVKQPVADFNATPQSGNAPLLVQFTDTSDGNPNFWAWRFGDGAISTAQNPFHVYTMPGVYNVSLTVKNAAGSDTITKMEYITVSSLPVANFAANMTSGGAPLVVKFTDQSSGVPTSWSWVFGDGATSTLQNPVHTYSTPGTYNVRLTVTNSAGTDVETRDGYITVSEGLQASFTYSTSNPGNYAPLTVAFTDTSKGTPTQWIWNFGDGYIAKERHPIHTYSSPGNYTATLTISDAWQSTSASQTIQVKQQQVVDFTASPTHGSVPLTVTLSDTSTGIDPAGWKWVFEGGPLYQEVRDGKNLVYTLNEPGNYTVTLEITDSDGLIHWKTRPDYIQVLPFP